MNERASGSARFPINIAHYTNVLTYLLTSLQNTHTRIPVIHKISDQMLINIQQL